MTNASEDPICAAVDSAEEIRDPLDDLLARTEADPGAPFAPDVLEALVALRQEDRARFEGLRAQLKRAGCRVTALDEALAEEAGDDSGRGPKQADLLIELAQEAELFHSPDATAFADLAGQRPPRNLAGPHQGFPSLAGAAVLRGDRRRAELRGPAVGAQRHRGQGPLRRTRAGGAHPRRRPGRASSTSISATRLGGRWRSTATAGAWSTSRRSGSGAPPACRHCRRRCQAVPSRRCGAFSTSRVTTTSSWSWPGRSPCCATADPTRCSCCPASRARPSPPSPPILRSLLDPNTAPLRALPREDRDLFIAANNGHVLAFDNVSGLPAWISDTLCRLATGGGFAVRQLYTDQDEVLFDAARPVILNGIEDIVTRPDLADRAIFLTLEADPRGAPPAGEGTLGGVQRRPAAASRHAARCGFPRPEATAGYPARQPAAHGRLCALGDGLRDRAMASRHFRRRLCGQPRRGRRQRHRGRSGGLCHPFADRYADGVDGNRLGPSGRP